MQAHMTEILVIGGASCCAPRFTVAGENPIPVHGMLARVMGARPVWPLQSLFVYAFACILIWSPMICIRVCALRAWAAQFHVSAQTDVESGTVDILAVVASSDSQYEHVIAGAPRAYAHEHTKFEHPRPPMSEDSQHRHTPLESQRMLLTLVEFVIVVLALHQSWRVMGVLRERALPLRAVPIDIRPRPPRTVPT
jgi:hypothetical protein